MLIVLVVVVAILWCGENAINVSHARTQTVAAACRRRPHKRDDALELEAEMDTERESELEEYGTYIPYRNECMQHAPAHVHLAMTMLLSLSLSLGR